jgi:4-aminobutyrate aminotransferase-like enzyme
LDSLIRNVSNNGVAAMVLEPIQGCGGHIMPPDAEYFSILRSTCDRHGTLLVVDEIQTGFGRTGHMWAYEHYGFRPDAVALGKALGGGLPVSATAFHDSVTLPDAKDQEILSTQSATPLGCVAGCAVIDIMEDEQLVQRANSLGAVAEEKLQGMQDRHSIIGDLRCAGLFIGIELVRSRETREPAVEETGRIVKLARDKGLLVLQSNKPGVGNVLKLKPPLNIPEDLLVQGLDILEEAIEVVESTASEA